VVSPAIPAGSYVRPNGSIKIDSIALRGVGVERQLSPRMRNDGRELDRYLAGEDDANASYFHFLDLPPGNYVLTVRANGYAPYSDHVTVELGRSSQWKPIMLRAEE
jgi:hypothetical protein